VGWCILACLVLWVFCDFDMPGGLDLASGGREPTVGGSLDLATLCLLGYRYGK
jgi:hypothetical protein